MSRTPLYRGGRLSLTLYNRALYAQLAEYYDRFYWWKDYRREVDFIAEVLDHYGVAGKKLLEVACGTGNHTRIFVSRGFQVTGVDLSPDQLEIARRNVAGRAIFVEGDMRELEAVIETSFDCAVCLFSSISYNLTMSDLRRTLRGFYAHLKPGGLVVFDTNFTREGFLDGYRGEDIFDDGRVMGARLSTSKRKSNLGEISFSYLIKDGPKVIQLRNDVHRLGLFRRDAIVRTMRQSGFRKTRVFSDWSLKRPKTTGKFKESIFIGQRPAS
jgi:SAM-dependent methyltransferase